MKLISTMLSIYLLMSAFSSYANNAIEDFEEYRQFFPLEKEINDADEVMIFFSFNSRDSYDLLVKERLIERLKDREIKFSLYHVDFYTSFDKYISELWYYVDIKEMQDKYFNDIFERMQSGIPINSEEYIKYIFTSVGISYYDLSKYYWVSNENADSRESKRKEMIKKLNVSSVPSIYVKGKYLINNEVINNGRHPDLQYIRLLDHLIYEIE